MTNIRNILSTIEIDQPTLQAAVGRYLDEMERTNPDHAGEIKQELGDNPSLADSAYRAAHDAFSLSTLAVTLNEDTDYEAALSGLKSIHEPFVAQIRRDLFNDSVKIAAQTLELEDAGRATLERRVQMTEEAFA
jgi:hypothetical protein